MKAAIIVLAALLAAGAIACFVGKHVETYRDHNVKAGEIHTPLSDFAVHVSEPQYLTINGKTYKGVRGLKPFYLDIPELNSILFVTEAGGEKVTFHIISLQSKKETAIDGGTSGFGWAIGSGLKSGEKGSDHIESVQSNKITIAKRSLNWKEITVLNLDAKRVERQEVYNYDQNGNTTNHSVSTNQLTH
jgi:hypothetical protein